jgi:hypothetical protein
LVTAPRQRSANVHEGVTLDLKLTVGDTRIGDWGGGDTSECTGEGLEVTSGLAAPCGQVCGRTEGGGDEGCDDESGLHFDEARDGKGIVSGYRIWLNVKSNEC